MTRFVVDTSAVSILSPRKRGLPENQAAIEQLRRLEPHCYLSAITVMEIESGVQQLMMERSTRQAPELANWLSGLIQAFGDRFLAIDEDVARVAGQIDALALARGVHPGLADLLIAATAKAKGMGVVTRNTRHFLPLEVPVIDPFNL